MGSIATAPRPTPRACREAGATAVEYSIIVSAIAAIIVLVVAALGIDTLNLFDVMENAFFGDGG